MRQPLLLLFLVVCTAYFVHSESAESDRPASIIGFEREEVLEQLQAEEDPLQNQQQETPPKRKKDKRIPGEEHHHGDYDDNSKTGNNNKDALHRNFPVKEYVTFENIKERT